MSFWTNLEGFFTSAEGAFKTVTTEAGPLISLAEEGASVVSTLVPSTAPVISTVEAAANSVAAIAPTAIADAGSLIANGRKAVTDLGPALSGLLTSLEGLFEATPAPGGAVLLTPKTSSANAPSASVAPPGNAVS